MCAGSCCQPLCSLPCTALHGLSLGNMKEKQGPHLTPAWDQVFHPLLSFPLSSAPLCLLWKTPAGTVPLRGSCDLQSLGFSQPLPMESCPISPLKRLPGSLMTPKRRAIPIAWSKDSGYSMSNKYISPRMSHGNTGSICYRRQAYPSFYNTSWERRSPIVYSDKNEDSWQNIEEERFQAQERGKPN